MSPATNTETAPASAGYSLANFTSVFAVLSSFNSIIRANIHEPEELENVIKCTEGSAKLKDLALALLSFAMNRKANSKTSMDQWPRCCGELAAGTVHILKNLEIPEVVADSLDSFAKQDLAVRVDVLYWLCEVTLANNDAVKKLIDQEAEKGRRATSSQDMKQDVVRLQPFAEIAKQRYWVFGTKTQRIYCESMSQKSKGRVELLAQTPDEFRSLAESLNGQRLTAHHELADRLANEVVPYLEQQIEKQERVKRKLQRNALAFANVHIYETRTRKRQRVNYAETEDKLDQLTL